MKSGRVRVGERILHASAHACERWWERVKPMLEQKDALEDLRTVLGRAGEIGGCPEWATAAPTTREWVTIGDGIAFPVENGVLITCVTRAQPSDETRERESAIARDKRAGKNARGKRSQHGKVKRGERARARSRREAYD